MTLVLQDVQNICNSLMNFLCRLKCGFRCEDLAVCLTFTFHQLAEKLSHGQTLCIKFLEVFIFGQKNKTIEQHMPQNFQRLYPDTRVKIDCREIFTEKSSLVLASNTFSTYKSHNTWEALVGIAPHETVTFVSSLLSGCMSDIEITKLPGLVDLLEPGDQIMADKGLVPGQFTERHRRIYCNPSFLV